MNKYLVRKKPVVRLLLMDRESAHWWLVCRSPLVFDGIVYGT